MTNIHIPVGISNFEEIRKREYYYVDKSGLIRELFQRTGAKVTLITRPRRFGKTLGMSMLENFFDIRKDSKKLFEGLNFTSAYVTEHLYLADRKQATEFEKEAFSWMASGNASESEIKGSLLLLTSMMRDYYGKPVMRHCIKWMRDCMQRSMKKQ